MLAPLIVFAYNRPDHLEKTLQALVANPRAKESSLFIFIDGPKNEDEIEKNKAVELVAEKFRDGYFKNVDIRNASQNRGLAKAVITGVSEIIEKYGKVIVTEDDAVCAPSYLEFMNGALEYYENEPSIFSIGGYTIPIKFPPDYTKDVILTQRSSSYAWATWKNRWDKIDWEISDYKKFRFNFKSRNQFNLWGEDRSSMLDDQILGRVNSWAIRFDYSMYKNNMYNILPSKSLIQNIGHDGSGTHGMLESFSGDPFAVTLDQNLRSFNFEKVEIVEQIRREFIRPFHSSKIDLAKRYIGNLYRGAK